MKKFLCILLTAILLLALTACSFNLPQFHSSKSEHDTPATDSTDNVTQNITHIYDFSDGLAIFKTDNGYGYLDEKGNIVIEPLLEYAGNFNTIAKVKKTDNSNYEYINKSGKTVYSFTGTEISVGDFSNGYFWVETKSETVAGNIHTMTYYDQNGNKAFSIENATPTVRSYPENNLLKGSEENKHLSLFNKWGYTVVTIGEYEKFVDTNGNIVNLKDFGLADFSENYTVSRVVGNYASVDRSLLFIDFENRTAEVIGSSSSLTMNIYDLKYKQLNDDYYATYDTTYYRATAGEYKNKNINHKVYRYILKNNEVVLDLTTIEDFGDAYILDVESIDINGKAHFNVILKSKDEVIFSSVIDIDGNTVIPPNKNTILASRSFYKAVAVSFYMDYSCHTSCSGLFLAKDSTTGKFGYVDITGTFVISPVYSSATEFKIINSTTVAIVNGSTLINANGKTIFSSQEN